MNESAWMEVDLDALASNARTVMNFVEGNNSNTKVLAVVKADGYGHGAVEVSRVFQREGIDYLGVATANEGIELRNHGITMPILVFGYVYDGLLEMCVLHNLTLTVYDLHRANLIEKIGIKHKRMPKIHIKVDVGMTRLGLPMTEANAKLIGEINAMQIDVEGIYGHFPLADSLDDAQTVIQAKAFETYVQTLREKGIDFDIVHLCNSAGMMRLKAFHFDMVRAGGILYGHYCLRHVILPEIISTKRAMSIRCRVANLIEVAAGRGISYGWKSITEHPSTIAALPLGYTDGIHRTNTNSTQFLCKGTWAKQVGLICMDQMMMDASFVDDVKIGDIVTLLGRDGDKEITLEMRAKDAGIGKCELFAGIGERLTKYYCSNNEWYSRNYIRERR